MKAMFNIKKLHLWPIASFNEKGTPTYDETALAMPGTVSLSLDHEGESTIFYADGVAYVTLNTATNYKGSLENALFTKEVLKAIYAYLEDQNKNLVETDGVVKEFGAKFACDTDDGKEVYFTLYRVSSTKPGINLQTKEESPTINPQSVDLTVSTVTTAAGVNIFKSYAEEGATNYANYFESAPEMPVFTA